MLLLDRSQLPGDVGAALVAIANFTVPQLPTPSSPSASVLRLLDRLDDRERNVLEARLWAAKTSTLESISAGMGVTRERVRQIQSKAEAKLRAFFADPQDRSVAWYADELGHRLGPCLPAEMADEVLRGLGVEVPSLVAQVLLYFAGPYALRRNSWLENLGGPGESVVRGAIDRLFDSVARPNGAAPIEALERVGMRPDAAEQYLRADSSLKRFGDHWVRWGGTVVEKAHRVLEDAGTPATPESINESIGEGHSLATLKGGMAGDSRFVRTGKRTWGLREWGVEEYSGIVEEIYERIDGAGGMIGAEELIRELVSTFPDVSESSIKMYLGTMAFVVEGGIVRRRNESDGWPDVGHFKDARGAFKCGDKELRPATSRRSTP